MISEVLHIFPQDEKANLVTYLHYNSKELNNPPRPAMIVCPGGGYGFLSDREAEPIAVAFLAKGFNCFILNYSTCEKATNYNPLCEAALAIKHVRENAEKYNVDKNRIFIVGFSAGGHLACSTGTLWNCQKVKETLGDDAEEGIGKPNGMILAYPVITAFEHTHAGTIYNLCGTTSPTDEQRMRFSLEHHVDNTSVPAFIWHTFEDGAVPVQNSLLLALAMKKNDIPFELHVFPKGPHGLSLANEETSSGFANMIQKEPQIWIDLAANWAKQLKI